MRSWYEKIMETKEPSGGSLQRLSRSLRENSHGETTPPQSPASLLERIQRFSRTPRGLAVISILWALFLIALVFVFIPLTSWETRPRALSASSTAALLWENELDGWQARKLFCFPSQPCDAWSPFSQDGPSNLRLEMQPEEVMRNA